MKQKDDNTSEDSRVKKDSGKKVQKELLKINWTFKSDILKFIR